MAAGEWTKGVNAWARARSFTSPEAQLQLIALKAIARSLDNELNASLVAQFQKAYNKLEELAGVAPVKSDPASEIDPLLEPLA